MVTLDSCEDGYAINRVEETRRWINIKINFISKKYWKLYWFTMLCSVQFSHSVVSDSLRLKNRSTLVSLSITNSRSLPKLMSIKSLMPSNPLILCHPLLLPPSIFPSISIYSNESALRIRWPKYWSFGFNINPSNEHPGLISFRMDWLDLLAAQGTLKSLLQHHSSKASILRCSAFFMVQLCVSYFCIANWFSYTYIRIIF